MESAETLTKAKHLLSANRVGEARELLLEQGFLGAGDGEIAYAYEQLLSPMPAAAAISRAKQLLAKGQHELARELLLVEGFVRRIDVSIATSYEKLIAASEGFEGDGRDALTQLRSADPKKRLDATTRLLRAACKEWSFSRKSWLGDPRTTGPLIRALGDRDPTVVDKAANAVAMTMRYLRDLRAFEPMIPLLKSPRKTTRRSAVLAIAALSHKDRWAALQPMLQDKAAEVRSVAIRAARSELGKDDLTPKARRELVDVLRGLDS